MSQDEMHKGTGRLLNLRIFTAAWWREAWAGVPEGWDGDPLYWKGNAFGALLFLVTAHIDHWILEKTNTISWWIVGAYGACVLGHLFIKMYQKGYDDKRAPNSRPGRMFVIAVGLTMFEFCMSVYVAELFWPGWLEMRLEFVAGFAAVMGAFVFGICHGIVVDARKRKDEERKKEPTPSKRMGKEKAEEVTPNSCARALGLFFLFLTDVSQYSHALQTRLKIYAHGRPAASNRKTCCGDCRWRSISDIAWCHRLWQDLHHGGGY